MRRTLAMDVLVWPVDVERHRERGVVAANHRDLGYSGEGLFRHAGFFSKEDILKTREDFGVNLDEYSGFRGRTMSRGHVPAST